MIERTRNVTWILWISISIVVYFSIGCLSSGMCLPSRSVTLTVINTYGAPISCRSWINRYRSSKPDFDQIGYCGVINTSYGPFYVRDSGWHLFGSSREDIVGVMENGCSYDVEYRGGRDGFANMVYRDAPLRNVGIPVIVDIGKDKTCQGRN